MPKIAKFCCFLCDFHKFWSNGLSNALNLYFSKLSNLSYGNFGTRRPKIDQNDNLGPIPYFCQNLTFYFWNVFVLSKPFQKGLKHVFITFRSWVMALFPPDLSFLPTVHSGQGGGNRQKCKFFKKQKFNIFMKIHKIWNTEGKNLTNLEVILAWFGPLKTYQNAKNFKFSKILLPLLKIPIFLIWNGNLKISLALCMCNTSLFLPNVEFCPF